MSQKTYDDWDTYKKQGKDVSLFYIREKMAVIDIEKYLSRFF